MDVVSSSKEELCTLRRMIRASVRPRLQSRGTTGGPLSYTSRMESSHVTQMLGRALVLIGIPFVYRAGHGEVRVEHVHTRLVADERPPLS